MLNLFFAMKIFTHRNTGLIVTMFATIALVAAEAQQPAAPVAASSPLMVGESGPGQLTWLTDLPQAQSLAKAGGQVRPTLFPRFRMVPRLRRNAASGV